MNNETFYDNIIGNDQLTVLTKQILADLEEKHDDGDKKVQALMSTISYGFSNLFQALPNLLITAHILKTQLETVEVTDEVKEVCDNIIDFIFDVSKSVDNDRILVITEQLRALTPEGSDAEPELVEADDESATDSESK